VGNILDFFLYGHVVDMLHIQLWGYTPFVFNVADAMISLSLCWLLLLQRKTPVSNSIQRSFTDT
jgi:signal peptidase II